MTETTGTIHLDDHRVFYDRRFAVEKDKGEKDLLLIHGFPLDHKMWIKQLDDLSQTHNVLAIDLPGFGQSDDLKHGTSIADMADCIAKVLDELKIEQVVFCGLSMGGYIGWQFWKRHRNRLNGLIFANTKAAADDETTRRARLINAQAADRNGQDWVAESMLPKLFAEENFSNRIPAVDRIDQTIRNTRLNGTVYGQLAMAAREDATEWLDQIEVPTLVVAGSEDTITPADGMKAMSDQMANSTFIEIQGAGHLSPLEKPEAFNSAVLKFLG